MLSVIIIEDNKIDSDYLQSVISQHSNFFEVKASFSNALEAQEYLHANKVDVIFLDIDMPVINGMDYFKQLHNPPLCIFVTAFSEYAWEGFEAQAFDYILKPVKPQRFAAMVNRLKEYLQIKARADLYTAKFEDDSITIKEGTTKHIIALNDILYIEALKDYSKVVTKTKSILTLSKLKHFLEQLPANRFVRIHRSYAIAINKIEKADANDIYINNTEIPIGKTFKNTLKLFL